MAVKEMKFWKDKQSFEVELTKNGDSIIVQVSSNDTTMPTEKYTISSVEELGSVMVKYIKNTIEWV